MAEKLDNAEPRRWYQFRLGTLLIAVALAGIVCVLGVQAKHKYLEWRAIRRERDNEAFRHSGDEEIVPLVTDHSATHS